MTSYKNLDIVLHVFYKNVIGIIRNENVEWWSINKDCDLSLYWPIDQYRHFLKLCPFNVTLPRRFEKRCRELGAVILNINKETDSPLVRKIKELDYKWELKMKQKGNFFLTSRAPNVDQETISQSTLTDTAIVSDVTTTAAAPFLTISMPRY